MPRLSGSALVAAAQAARPAPAGEATFLCEIPGLDDVARQGRGEAGPVPQSGPRAASYPQGGADARPLEFRGRQGLTQDWADLFR